MRLKYIQTLSLLLLITATSLAQFGGNRFGRLLSGTKITEDQKAFIDSHLEKIQDFTDTLNTGIKDLPVKIHVLQKSDGSGGVSVDEVKAAIENLNNFFLKIYIRFVPLGDYNYVNNDFFYEFDRKTEDEFCKIHDAPNVINLYIVGKLKEEYNTFCGATYYPKEKDNINRVFIAKKFFNNGVTLPRQMGHFFSLYPTHGVDEENRSEELVNGSNCATTGDCICDTPADPKLGAQSVDERCGYIGKAKDGHNKFYRPKLDNIMCDNPRFECRIRFTGEQYRRMQYAIRYLRPDLEFPKNAFSKKQLKMLMEKSGVEADIRLNLNGKPTPVILENNLYRSKWPYRAGDEYTIEITNQRKGYIYVLEGDKARGVNFVYPRKGDKIYFKDEQTVHTIPQGDQPFRIDNVRGYDGLNYICVLFSKKQLPTKEYVSKLRSVRGDWDLMQIVYKAFGSDLVPTRDIEYHKNIGVSALTTERFIVPIFIEIEQE